MTYRLKVAGVERDLPICPINDHLDIAGFVMFGDVELTKHAAMELLKLAPEYDVMITAESKGIPLFYEMARLAGHNYYSVARKSPKLYMKDGEILILSTGSQGESMSALTRMAANEFKKITLGENDCVIISARPIPGNEKTVYKVINDLNQLNRIL